MNPLIGPRLRQDAIYIVAREWGNLPDDIDNYLADEQESTDSKNSSCSLNSLKFF